jgi:hypothetical protein
MLDSDLAALYDVETRTLVQALKRNRDRFPADFVFQLTRVEYSLLRSQIVISKRGRGGRRYPPYAFTEHGAVMLASVLNSPQAIETSVFVVRAFVRLRETLAVAASGRPAMGVSASIGLHIPPIHHILSQSATDDSSPCPNASTIPSASRP